MTLYLIYDMKENEQCLGVFENRIDVAKYLNSTSNSVGSKITRKELYKKRYLIERIKI